MLKTVLKFTGIVAFAGVFCLHGCSDGRVTYIPKGDEVGGDPGGGGGDTAGGDTAGGDTAGGDMTGGDTAGGDPGTLDPTADADGDGLPNGDPANPCSPSAGSETCLGTNPLLVDTDGDGITDGDEIAYDGDDTAYTPGADTHPLLASAGTKRV